MVWIIIVGHADARSDLSCGLRLIVQLRAVRAVVLVGERVGGNSEVLGSVINLQTRRTCESAEATLISSNLVSTVMYLAREQLACFFGDYGRESTSGLIRLLRQAHA